LEKKKVYQSIVVKNVVKTVVKNPSPPVSGELGFTAMCMRKLTVPMQVSPSTLMAVIRKSV
jgi:hypothetical protein